LSTKHDAPEKSPSIQYAARWFVVLLGLSIVGLLGSACGQSPCAGKTCEFGVCDSSTGQCTNADSCRVDDECVLGYSCTDGSCQPEQSCEADEDCDTGNCEDGACVNPDSCSSNSECVDRSYCSPLGNCLTDPCHEVQCKRGVCQPGTDDCVSADTCTQRTELQDCVAGEQCADGQCEPRETFCNNLDCPRGICSFEGGGCVNAPDCEGDDSRCTEGYFCNNMNRCAPNLCERQSISCGDRGTCQPATGKCMNPEECEVSAECVENHVCVDQTCRLRSMACGDGSGDGGCPGNKTCDYDPSNQTADCAEPEVCETSVDCNGNRQCGGRSCLPAASCRDDIYEPNDMYAEATVLTQVSQNASASGSVCAGDTDTYLFLTTDIVSPTTEGTIVVDVSIPERDIGLGGAELILKNSDRQEIGSTTLGAMGQEGEMRLTTPLGVTEHGEYIVEVRPAEDLKSPPGLSYDLTVNILPDSTVQACENARSISVDERLSSDLGNATSSSLKSSCLADEGASSNESIFELNVPESREVTVSAVPQVQDLDISLAMRGRCLDYATERVCRNGGGPGATETISRVLSAGTYYLIVQTAGDNSDGSFDLAVDGGYTTTCAEGDSYCGNPTISNICVSDGSGYESFSCISGCNPSTGRCFPPEGDRCVSAPDVQKGAGGYNVDYPLGQLTDEYTLQPGGCIDSTDPRTGGPDRTFNVQIPPQNAFTAQVSFGGGVEGSMYLAESCGDISGTCSKGVQDSGATSSQEVLRYANTTNQFQTRKLVVDTAAGQNYENAQVSITYAEIICEPGMKQCNQGGNVETCNDIGTGYNVSSQCFSWACSMGSCQRPDTCMEAVDVTQKASRAGGVLYQDNWGELSNDYEGSGCAIQSDLVVGNESVYKVTLQAGEVLDANLTSSFPVDNDPVLYLMPSCGELDSTCLDGDIGGNSAANIEYYAPQQQTVYLIADADDTTDETFELELQIRQSTCTAYSSSCQGGDVQYCQANGLAQQTYSCDGGGCSNGFCSNNASDFCWDAEDVTSQLKASGGLTKTIDWSNFSADVETDNACGVRSFDSDGEDAFYRVDLAMGETLNATLNPNGSSADATLTVVQTCLKHQVSCVAGDAPFNGNATVSYTASSSETVYLIADHDNSFSTPSTDFTLTGSIQ